MKQPARVIDMKTREPWRIEQHRPADRIDSPMERRERVTAYLEGCCNRILDETRKIAAVTSLETARNALRKIADEYGTGRK